MLWVFLRFRHLSRTLRRIVHFQFVFIGHIFYIDLDLWQMTVSWRLAGCGRYFGRTELSYAGQNDGTIEIKTAIQNLRKWVFGALETKTPEGVDLKVELYSGEGPWVGLQSLRGVFGFSVRKNTDFQQKNRMKRRILQKVRTTAGRYYPETSKQAAKFGTAFVGQ